MKRLMFSILPLLALACTREADVPRQSDGTGITQITAFFDDTDKTVLADDKETVLWSPNDTISVFFNEIGLKFTSLNTKPASSTTFASDKTLIFGKTENGGSPYLYAVYPYSSTNAQDGDKLTLTVPSCQTAIEGSFMRGGYPSIGRSKDTNIGFYNVCGGVRFTLSQGGIRKIVFTGNNNENLAGKVQVRFDGNERPEVVKVVDGSKSVTLTAPEGGEFQTGKWYYMSVLPAVLSKGVSFEFIKRQDESERGTRSIAKQLEVKRSCFGTIEKVDKGVVFHVDITAMSISPSKVDMDIMSSTPLSLKVLPADAEYEWIKWTSSDNAIATVDENGKVVGRKNGVCTVTATVDNGMSASCAITVAYRYMDLGLSVKWGTSNIGAVNSESGYCERYFAWGDISGQTWNGSLWSEGEFARYPEYALDDNGNLKPDYDAVHVMLGGTWRMPTQAEFQELVDNCNCTWTNDYNETGVAGMIFTGKKGGYTSKSIFLPAAGGGSCRGLYYVGACGYYRSGTVRNDSDAWTLDFKSGAVNMDGGNRGLGFSVRPVCE